MMAGGYAACQPARKTLQAGGLRGEGQAPRFAPLTVLFPLTLLRIPTAVYCSCKKYLA